MDYENNCCICGDKIEFEFEGRSNYLRFDNKNGDNRLVCNECLECLKIELQWE